MMFPHKMIGEERLKIRLRHSPKDSERLQILYEVGRILEDVFRSPSYLHEGCRLCLKRRSGERIWLNDYADSGLYISSAIRSYVRLDFLDFLFFLLVEMRRGGEGCDLLVGRKFRLLLPFEDTMKPCVEEVLSSRTGTAFDLKFPLCFDKDSAEIKVIFGPTSNHHDSHRWRRLVEELNRRVLPIEVDVRGGVWRQLTSKELSYLLRSNTNYTLRELFQILSSIKPIRSEVEYLAGRDVIRYREERRKRILYSINDIERRFTSIKARKDLSRIKVKLWRWGSSLEESLRLADGEELKECEAEIEDFYIRRWMKNNPISCSKPKKRIVFKLWERDVEDLFTGDYSSTCIALNTSEVMPLYMEDEYTEFFRILVNGRRMGHIKMFYCRDEDGADVLHIDFIGLSGGKYKPLHREIKLYAVAAVIRFARSRKLKKVYVAREIVPDLKASVIKNQLVKKGADHYSQYLTAEKFLVWESQVLEHPYSNPNNTKGHNSSTLKRQLLRASREVFLDPRWISR